MTKVNTISPYDMPDTTRNSLVNVPQSIITSAIKE